MSKLSELLPAGGSAKEFEVVASGTLASGQAVILKSDGTIAAVAQINVSQSLGSSATFESGTAAWTSCTFDSNSNKVVMAYQDDTNSDYGTAVVGTVSGTSITFGTPVVFASAATLQIGTAFDSSSNTVVISYQDVGNGSKGTAIVGTVNGTSISFGSEVVFNSNNYTEQISITFDSNANKVVIVDSYGKASVGTVSGTSISFGTGGSFNGGVSYNVVGVTSCTFDSSSNKVVVVYMDIGNSYYATAVVGTISGTAISFGAERVYHSANHGYPAATFDSNSNKVVVAFRGGSNNKGSAVVGTVSGTSISFGTVVNFDSDRADYISATFDSDNNKIVISYQDYGNSYYGTLIVGTVSGTNISFGTPVIFNSGDTRHISNTFDSNSNVIVTSYQRYTGNPQIGKGIVFKNAYTSTNNTDFAGLVTDSISSGATGVIIPQGGVSTNQTSLTIGSDYYVQANGTLSTASTSPAVQVGKAISATSLILKGNS